MTQQRAERQKTARDGTAQRSESAARGETVGQDGTVVQDAAVDEATTTGAPTTDRDASTSREGKRAREASRPGHEEHLADLARRLAELGRARRGAGTVDAGDGRTAEVDRGRPEAGHARDADRRSQRGRGRSTGSGRDTVEDDPWAAPVGGTITTSTGGDGDPWSAPIGGARATTPAGQVDDPWSPPVGGTSRTAAGQVDDPWSPPVGGSGPAADPWGADGSGGSADGADGADRADGGRARTGGDDESGSGSARRGSRGGRGPGGRSGGSPRAGGRARGRGRGRGATEPPEDGAAAVDVEPDPESVARSVALRLLTGAPRSRAQLAEAMARRDVPEEVADRVLDRFTDVGLVDDAAYAEVLVRSRHAERGLSRRALAMELRRRGVDEETAAEALEQVDDTDEESAARALARRKLASTRGLDRETRMRRTYAALGRKGYGGSMVSRVVREELAAEGERDTDAWSDEPLG